MLRDCKIEDAAQIADIYNYYIQNTTITFEKETLSSSEISNRIISYTDTYPWLVYEVDNLILGYAYASQWRPRKAYQYSAEASIYLNPDKAKTGLGTILYSSLISRLKEHGIHSVIGVITLPNDSSIKLHKKLGFREVGIFTEIGRKFNKWLDTSLWELVFKEQALKEKNEFI